MFPAEREPPASCLLRRFSVCSFVVCRGRRFTPYFLCCCFLKFWIQDCVSEEFKNIYIASTSFHLFWHRRISEEVSTQKKILTTLHKSLSCKRLEEASGRSAAQQFTSQIHRSRGPGSADRSVPLVQRCLYSPGFRFHDISMFWVLYC